MSLLFINYRISPIKNIPTTEFNSFLGGWGAARESGLANLYSWKKAAPE